MYPPKWIIVFGHAFLHVFHIAAVPAVIEATDAVAAGPVSIGHIRAAEVFALAQGLTAVLFCDILGLHGSVDRRFKPAVFFIVFDAAHRLAPIDL